MGEAAVGERRQLGCAPEETAEKGLVGEAECFADLQYGPAGNIELDFSLKYEAFGYPDFGRATTGLGNYSTQVARSYG